VQVHSDEQDSLMVSLGKTMCTAARECLSQMVDACKEAGAELTVGYTSMREDMMSGPDT